MADDFAELALGHQESRADPTLDVISVAPAFDVAANGFDNLKADSITFVQHKVQRS